MLYPREAGPYGPDGFGELNDIDFSAINPPTLIVPGSFYGLQLNPDVGCNCKSFILSQLPGAVAPQVLGYVCGTDTLSLSLGGGSVTLATYCIDLTGTTLTLQKDCGGVLTPLCAVDLTTALNPVLSILDEGVLQCTGPTTIDFVGGGATATCLAGVLTVTIPARQNIIDFQDEGISQCLNPSVFNVTGAGATLSCVAGVATLNIPAVVPPSVGYAEYVQHSQSTNNSVAPGTAIEYLTDNPLGVYNTIGIATNTGPGAVGTAFNLPIGTYMVDYENSADAAWSLAIYQGLSNTVLAIDTDTIAGASTATTRIHGRAIVTVTAAGVDDWIMVSPVVGTQAIPTAGTAAGEFIARITFLKIA